MPSGSLNNAKVPHGSFRGGAINSTPCQLPIRLFDVVARQGAIEGRAGLQSLFIEDEQDDPCLGGADPQLDPPLFPVKRLVGEHRKPTRSVQNFSARS